jgi:heme A synthase
VTASEELVTPSPSRRLAALFCAALLGVLTALGIVALELGGPLALAAYAAVAAAVVLVGAAKGRAARRAAARRAGRSCDCCATTVHDPVEVV